MNRKVLYFFFLCHTTPQDLHYPLRRHRQMCIRAILFFSMSIERRDSALRLDDVDISAIMAR